MLADGRLGLHLHAGALPALLSSLVRREVAAVGGDPTLIFRGNSGVTKLLEAYCTMCAAPCRGVYWMSGWRHQRRLSRSDLRCRATDRPWP